MRLRVLVAPSGFKESLSADEVADSIAIGIRRAVPDALVRKAPMADGGEGFAAALALATGGQLHPVRVTGPVGKKVDAAFAMLGGDRHEPTAVFEMAAAAGLRLVPRTKRDPLTTTTRGVGEMLLAALDEGARRVLIGCGDSGTNDGGAGMAQALGVHLHDEDGNELGAGGGELQRLASIDVTGRDPRIADTDIEVACNWTNVLTGPQGVAQVYGPQKGASPETVERLEQALDRYADVVDRELGTGVRTAPGTGASGGLGAGLWALAGARLRPRFEVISEYLDLDALIADAHLVITAEGAIDRQTPRGKVPAEVARLATERDVPVIALTGTLGEGVRAALDAGLDAYASIIDHPCTLAEALESAQVALVRTAEQTMRMLLVGRRLAWAAAAAAVTA